MAKTKGTGRSRAKTSSTVAAESAAPSSSDVSITVEERRRRIAEAAYFRAQARGFLGGNPVEDWLAAEAEVNRAWPPAKQ